MDAAEGAALSDDALAALTVGPRGWEPMEVLGKSGEMRAEFCGKGWRKLWKTPWKAFGKPLKDLGKTHEKHLRVKENHGKLEHLHYQDSLGVLHFDDDLCKKKHPH